MRFHALLLAIVSGFLFLASPLSAQTVSQQCALDAAVTDGGQTFNLCPTSGARDAAITAGFTGARLDPGDALSATALNLYSDSQCRYVDARGTSDALFIPFHSQAEWAAFLANAPSGVHMAQCCQPRPLTVGDVPPISAVPNVASCSTGWVFNGLVDPNNFNRLLAAPQGTTASSTFTLQAGVNENPDYPINALPIARDDIDATLPKGTQAGASYVAKYSCVTTSGNTTNTQIQLIQFAMQCAAADWSFTGSGCSAGTIAVFTEPCPDGSSGSIFKQITRACPSGETTVQTLSNTCTGSCVPGQVGSSTTTLCPNGQTGQIVTGQFRQCPSGTIVTQTISNTCSGGNSCTPPANICPSGSTASCTRDGSNNCNCTCSGSCPTGQTDLGVTTTQCPNGQNGVIQTHNFRSCTNTNNQCVCSLAATEEDNCSTGATCVPTTAPDCPTGQSPVCTNAGAGGACECLCAPTTNPICSPRTVTTATQSCPAGQTGVITLQQVRVCSSTQTSGSTPDGTGCFCSTTTQQIGNTCTTPPTQCVASTDLGQAHQPCPYGEVGSVIVNIKKVCTPSAGCTQGGSCAGACACHFEQTEVTRACEPCMAADLGNSTQACPAGQSGAITVHTLRNCTAVNNACVCSDTTTQVSNTCSGESCAPATDLGTKVLACPDGQSGAGITVHTVKECSATNNQCVCVNRYTVVRDQCAAQCTPATDLGTVTRACPNGQTGSIVIDRVRVCTPCNGNQCQCSVQEVPVSNSCRPPQCTPSTRTQTLDNCPDGQAGSIVTTIAHVCDCPGGRDVIVSVRNTCRPVPPQCMPSSHTEMQNCPFGFTGSIVKTVSHICDCPGGRDVVTNVQNSCMRHHPPHCPTCGHSGDSATPPVLPGRY